MITRRLTLGILASAAAIATASAHPHDVLTDQQRGDIERQIMTFRSALKDAALARDGVRLKAMYAASFTHTHGSGDVAGREATIASLLAGEPAIETASATELSFRVHGPDLVILTGRSAMRTLRENREDEVRWVQVYARASGAWRLAVSQETRLPTTS